MSNKIEKHIEDRGLGSRSSDKDEIGSLELKQQLQHEIAILTQKLNEQQGRSPDLVQSYKEMINSRVVMLKKL